MPFVLEHKTIPGMFAKRPQRSPCPEVDWTFNVARAAAFERREDAEQFCVVMLLDNVKVVETKGLTRQQS